MDLLAGTKAATSGLLAYPKRVIAESFGPIQESPPPHPMSSSLMAKLTGMSIILRQRSLLTFRAKSPNMSRPPGKGLVDEAEQAQVWFPGNRPGETPLQAK